MEFETLTQPQKIFVFFCLVFLFSQVIALVLWHKTKKFAVTAAKAQATITHVGTSPQNLPEFTFTFTDGNGEQHTRKRQQRGTKHQVGDTLTVYYDPKNLGHLQHFETLPASLFLLICLTPLVMLAGTYIAGISALPF